MFYNQRTPESPNVLGTGSDQWNLSAPAYESDSRVCNKHICQASAKELEDIITRFFEGGDWRGVKEFRFDSWTYENEVRYGHGAAWCRASGGRCERAGLAAHGAASGARAAPKPPFFHIRPTATRIDRAGPSPA